MSLALPSPELRRERLSRLLRPGSVAVFGGETAAEVIRRCRAIGFAGAIWPVNPRRAQIEGLPTFANVDALPAVPDAAFIAVAAEPTVEIVAALARRGAAGAVCYASGFAEIGAEGSARQRRLVEAAGAMALLGPNCYGAINFLDGCALWPDHFGGGRVARGVALVTQSGNIALNLTMQRRHLPIAHVITLGNQAVTQVHEAIDALLDDRRVTAIGLHLEGLVDVAAFARAAQRALASGVPIVALKAGSSAIGAELTASHTRSLAGPDVLYSALFARCGVARVADLDELLETLKLLHACGPLAGPRVGSLSCSGGDASLVADLGQRHGIDFPRLGAGPTGALGAVLGPQVPIHNPLDYQTAIWGDTAAMSECFAAMMRAPVDVCLLVLDFPRTDTTSAAEPAGASDVASAPASTLTSAPATAITSEASPTPGWDEVVDAFIAAHARVPMPAILVSSLPELMPAAVAARLLAAGIAPLQGLRAAMVAIGAAARIGARRAAPDAPALPAPLPDPGPAVMLDEVAAKAALRAHGLRTPAGREVHGVEQAVDAAEAIGYPVVLKAVSAQLAHKTEQGAVLLGLADAAQVRAAAAQLLPRFGRVLVEQMVPGALAELIVGVSRDAQFGLALTIGAGGILVEMLADSATLLLPVTRADIESAVRGLKCFALLDGYRGKPRADIGALVDAIAAVVDFAQQDADRLVELDVNPLIVTPNAAVAVDVLIRMGGNDD